MTTKNLRPGPTPRRLVLLRLAGLCTAAALPDLLHASYNVWTQTYTFSQAEIATRLAPHFPLTLRPSPLLAAELSNPVVALHPQHNRLAVATRVRIASPLLARTALGTLVMQTGLRYRPADRALCLHEPETERLEFGDLSPRDNQNLQLATSTLAREALDGYPLHVFAPEELRYGNRSFEPDEITVTTEGIAVRLRAA